HHFISQLIPELFAPDNRERLTIEIAQLQENASKTTSEGIVAALSGMRDRSSNLHTLLTLPCPVLFIGGKQDQRIPVDKLLSQAILPRHAEVLLLDGCGHMGYLEAEETTLKAIKHFAERILY
ncbi:MAG: alpha/beta hydrolase, partial [Bacteroidetes bacterium HGW-Bacteroidetes-22]